MYTYNEEKITLETTEYADGTLAILMNDEQGFPYGRLTVNLGIEDLPENWAAVDTNNLPGIDQFIENNELGEFTGYIIPSGFCQYPIYKFYRDKIVK